MGISEISDIEKNRLIYAFPSSLKQDIEVVINILPFDYDILLADGQICKVDGLIHSTEQPVSLDGESLKIPCRIYFNEPQADKEKQLTSVQTTILNCIYLRHHNGFVRQQRLVRLIGNTDYFVTPYTFQLLGDYVLEILDVLNRCVNDKTIDNYVRFIYENKKYWQQTESRMASYWNEYYRWPKFPKLQDYIGKQIIDRIANRLLC